MERNGISKSIKEASIVPLTFYSFLIKKVKQIMQNGNILKLDGGHIGAYYIILSCFLYL